MSFTRIIVVSAGLALAAFNLAACGGSKVATSEADMEHPITHQVSPADIAAAKSEKPIAADSAVLWVNGMGCPLCASNIDKQLLRLRGVNKADVDLGQGVVTLGFRPGDEHPSPARLGEAVEDAGFTLVKVVQP